MGHGDGDKARWVWPRIAAAGMAAAAMALLALPALAPHAAGGGIAVLDVRSRHRGRLARQCAVVRVRGARFAVTRQRLGSRLTTVSGQTVCQGIGAPGTIARGGAP